MSVINVIDLQIHRVCIFTIIYIFHLDIFFSRIHAIITDIMHMYLTVLTQTSLVSYIFGPVFFCPVTYSIKLLHTVISV